VVHYGIGIDEISDNSWFYDAIDYNISYIDLPDINASIKIAIIDSGFNGSLNSLIGNVWINNEEIESNQIDDDLNGYIDDYFGFDFVKNSSISSTAESYTSHATFIAHQLGGIKTDDSSIVGLVPNISLFNIRILDEKNSITESKWSILSDALDYAISENSDIIILSSEFKSEPPESVKNSFSDIYDAQIPLITISGNSIGKVTSYPALLEWTITVGAIERDDSSDYYVHAPYSNVGYSVDLVAPGTNIISNDIGGNQIMLSGTSFAAPYVAGTIAWMKIINNSLTILEIKNILVNSATKTGDCYSNGAGILNFTKTILVTQGKLPLPENIEANKSLCNTNINTGLSFITANLTFFEMAMILVITMILVKGKKNI
jgi:subtilisin family serine protease